MGVLVLAVAALALIMAIYLYTNKKKLNYPPGPSLFKAFKMALKIDSTTFAHEILGDLCKPYGSLCSIQIGPYVGVLLDDFKSIKEAFSDPAITGRPDHPIFRAFADGTNGIVATEGKTWSVHRRFTLRHMKEHGLGKNDIERRIMDEAHDLIEIFKKSEGKPMDVSRLFTLCVLNVIWAIITGKRNGYNESRLTTALENVFRQLIAVSTNGVLLAMPFLRYIIPEWCGWAAFKGALDDANNCFSESINEHKETLQVDNPRDFIDAFLIEAQTSDDPNFKGEAGEKHLKAIMGDLFAAGTQTTAATLTFAILYLTTFPKVQVKLQEEIDNQIGKNRLPGLGDKNKMPYTEAMINEILRMSSIGALGIGHTAMADTKLMGYDIPKGTNFISNLYSVHTDPKIWGDPENFRPERFLTEDGKTVIKREELVPFSYGKRSCIGELLVRDELFLIITSLFQRFHMELDVNSEGTSLKPAPGFMLTPREFNIVVKDRCELIM